MDEFRSFKTATRKPAVAMQPVVDPAGWTADDLRDLSKWSYPITDVDADELEAASPRCAPRACRSSPSRATISR
jgi:hypothetical protein